MKILIAGFQHETNTFAPSEADWDSFVEGGGMPGMVEGEALLDFKGINLPLGGFLDDLEGEGHEYLPVIWASASPSTIPGMPPPSTKLSQSASEGAKVLVSC